VTLRKNKKYLRLVVTWAANQGIRQFIDLGWEEVTATPPREGWMITGIARVG